MKITNIRYDISGDDDWEMDFQNLPFKIQAKIVGMTVSKYSTLSGEERAKAYNDICNNGTNAVFNKQFRLQNCMTIPKTVHEDSIADYISDKTGYCVYGWENS